MTTTETNAATNAAKIDTAETHPVGKKMTMAEAINAALRDAMAADERVLVFGEDVGRLGGVFRVTDGLTETFGDQRCFDTPLAES
ncbi:MAG: 2-oxoisovalerate dehydrogenase component beta subunit, partial [Pseudonocardiales bacterium]|nr:2-oxoisovalerate dehydrogenase component beta subunit [Pseudonocardiales bacterium]